MSLKSLRKISYLLLRSRQLPLKSYTIDESVVHVDDNTWNYQQGCQRDTRNAHWMWKVSELCTVHTEKVLIGIFVEVITAWFEGCQESGDQTATTTYWKIWCRRLTHLRTHKENSFNLTAWPIYWIEKPPIKDTDKNEPAVTTTKLSEDFSAMRVTAMIQKSSTGGAAGREKVILRHSNVDERLGVAVRSRELTFHYNNYMV